MSTDRTKPEPVTGTVAKVQTKPTHKASYRHPLPADEITKYGKTTTLGKLIPRSAVETCVQDFLVGASDRALKEAGGVSGIMQKVVGDG